MEIIKNGFKNPRLGIELDVYKIDGKEWFKAQDVAEHLRYRDGYTMLRNLDSIEENSTTQTVCSATNGYSAKFINETALYEITLKIRKSDAERYERAREYQKWVCYEVLPSLRQNNFYIDNDHITSQQKEQLMFIINGIKNGGTMMLSTFAKEYFPEVEDAYEKLLKLFRIRGWIDNNNYYTTALQVYQRSNEAIITCHQELDKNGTVINKVRLTAYGKAMMVGNIYYKNNEFRFRKWEEK